MRFDCGTIAPLDISTIAMQPDWYTLADYLIEQFPARRAEIEETYFDQLEVLANPYPHAFLEEFLARLLYGALPNAEEGDRLRAGRILDELLTSSDEDLAGAAIVSILELLRDNPPLRQAAQPFLGPVASSWLTRLMESLPGAEPRSGETMKPTARAVGKRTGESA